ncbi:MAG: beta-CASP ribonuclease aCPSF1 [Nanoarchaeota archaeon]|nr:beta-CASP ribonuclease aCPSF1 [Nanoarchaeota archaeon]MBU1631968.1 beta-CASP ribonuclease aCPSF1 [Nanoarchaeota archaeon]MBU1875980.1 beta-CASP ribonuclease aCPSF1 [Nanoarchaeota archaeon]
MANILKEIIKILPEDKISDAAFEGANIVLYTKDKKFFLDNKGSIKDAVKEFRKRIELRPDPSLCMDLEKAKKEIQKLIPEEAGAQEFIFDPPRSQVIIHADKPGLVIGKQGEILKDIREKTLWVPLIKRLPPIRSKLIESIRSVLYENADERKKFLDKTGHRIYDGWIREKKHEWVRLSCLGASRQVGRTCFLLQTPESRVLIDCGIDPSQDEGPEAYPFLDAPEFNISEIDAIIVTHSHLDHSGLLPYLFKFGYRGPVYCTLPTRDVMSLLQLDMIKIQRSEGKEPIYSSEEVRQMVLHTICPDYEEVTDITPDVRLTFYNAGHILGSSIVHLNIGNGLHNFAYTGDLKYARTNVLEPANTQFPRLETLMMEATYGGKTNVMAEQEADEYMIKTIKETFERGGKVLMPVLGSGRAQEVMIIVERLMREKKIPDAPVYIDGMLWDITAIHTAYPEYLNRNIREQIFHKENNPFLSEIFKKVGSSKERKQIMLEEGPCLILATSGMLTGGPSVEYLKGLAEGDKHSLIFSCYQPPGSLGHRIREGEKELMLRENGKTHIFKINLEVHKVEITNHSDRRQLMNYVKRCNPQARKVIVVHGESSRCLDLASSIHKQFRIETIAPKNLEVIRLK